MQELSDGFRAGTNGCLRWCTAVNMVTLPLLASNVYTIKYISTLAHPFTSPLSHLRTISERRNDSTSLFTPSWRLCLPLHWGLRKEAAPSNPRSRSRLSDHVTYARQEILHLTPPGNLGPAVSPHPAARTSTVDGAETLWTQVTKGREDDSGSCILYQASGRIFEVFSYSHITSVHCCS